MNLKHSYGAFALTAFALACGGTSHLVRGSSLDDLRRAASERPNDPEIAALVAEAELLHAGGDPARAATAIEHAVALAPDDIRVRFLHVLERDVHGELDAAYESLIQTLKLARDSSAPYAASIAEIATRSLSEYDDAVPNFDARTRDELTPLFDQPGHLGLQARHRLGEELIELAYRRGDLDEVHRVAGELGCFREFRVAGPFGPRQLLAFDQALSPEEAGPLAASYDLGPARGDRETRAVQPRGCTLHLGGGPVTAGGATYAETTLRVESAGTYLVRLESPNAVELFVDDVSVAKVDRLERSIGRVTTHRVELTPGEHRLLVKTVTRHPNPILVLSVQPSEETLVESYPDGDAPFDRVVRAAQAMASSDLLEARQALWPLANAENASSTVLILATSVALSDRLMGQQVGSDEARRFVGAALQNDPMAWYPQLQRARLIGDELESIRILREAVETWPKVIILPLSLVDGFQARGWDAEVDAMLSQAERAVPDACRPARVRLQIAERFRRVEEIERLSQRMVECDARSDQMAQLAIAQRRWDSALEEVRRIAALEPPSSQVPRLDAELTLARARGDQEEIERLLGELAERMPRAESVTLMRVDRRLAAGDREDALQTLRDAIGREPSDLLDLRRQLRILGDEAEGLDAYRVDGRQIIREFEASGRTYNQPKVLVFDYTVMRMFGDGSTLELTHQIHRLQSEEAVDQEGEYSPPEGAELLTLRTIKADGRRLEPDEIQGKDTISLPNLAVGDYVETEYVRAIPPPSGYPGGTIGWRFYFSSFELPFDRSELTVIVPEDVHPVIDPRGPAPETEETVENGQRILRWRVRGSHPPSPEPSSVHSREFLPSIQWGVNATWESYVDTLRDALADKSALDPAHVALVRQVLGPEANLSADEKAKQLFYWVTENIEDSNAFFGQAATMVHDKSGSRARVLAYLLGIAGVEADLVLARSMSLDSTVSELADDDTYRYLLVRARGQEGALWLWPNARSVPFGYLPLDPAIRGQAALVLNAEHEQTEVPSLPIDTDLTQVEIDIYPGSDGGARVRIVERLEGAMAIGWRQRLQSIPAAQLEEIFARQYVAQIAPGARMRELQILGRDNVEMPLEFVYEFEVSQLGRATDDGQLIPQLHKANLAGAIARVAQRQTTQFVTGGARDVLTRIHLPEGAANPRIPEARHLTGPDGMRADWSARMADGVVIIERSIRADNARVTPDEYPALVDFARGFDEAEEGEFLIPRGATE